MVLDLHARAGAADLAGDLPKPVVSPLRSDLARRHVINRNMQSRSGRLYCNEDLEFEIPSLDLYEAR